MDNLCVASLHIYTSAERTPQLSIINYQLNIVNNQHISVIYGDLNAFSNKTITDAQGEGGGEFSLFQLVFESLYGDASGFAAEGEEGDILIVCDI